MLGMIHRRAAARSTTRDDRARARPRRPRDSSQSIPSPDYRRRRCPVVGPAARTCAPRRRSEPREAVCLWTRSSSRRQRSMESVRPAGPVLRVVVARRRASHLRPLVSAQRMHDLRRGSRRRRCPSRRPCCSHPMPSRRMALRPQATRTHSRDPSQRLGAAGSSPCVKPRSPSRRSRRRAASAMCDRFIARPQKVSRTSELEDPRITDCGDLVERGHRVRRIGAGAEIRIRVSGFARFVRLNASTNPSTLTPPAMRNARLTSKVQTEEVAPDSRVPRDQRHGPHVEVRRSSRTVGERPAVRALQVRDAGRDVERERRVVLQQGAHLESVTDALPCGRRRRHRRIDCAIDHAARCRWSSSERPQSRMMSVGSTGELKNASPTLFIDFESV